MLYSGKLNIAMFLTESLPQWIYFAKLKLLFNFFINPLDFYNLTKHVKLTVKWWVSINFEKLVVALSMNLKLNNKFKMATPLKIFPTDCIPSFSLSHDKKLKFIDNIENLLKERQKVKFLFITQKMKALMSLSFHWGKELYFFFFITQKQEDCIL